MRSIINITFAVLVLLISDIFSGSSHTAEDSLVITPGRPTFSMTPLAVPPGKFILEMGYTFQRVEGVSQNVIGEVLLRYGLWKNLEFRLIGNSYMVELVSGGESTEGFQDPGIGIKYTFRRSSYQAFNLLDPSIGLHVFSTIPVGNEVYTSGRFQPGIMLTVEFPLSAKTTLVMEGVYLQQFVNEESTSERDFSASIHTAFSPSVGAFVEYYRLMPLQSPKIPQYIQSGIVFTFNRLATLDFRLGTGLGDSRGDFLFGTGGAIMF